MPCRPLAFLLLLAACAPAAPGSAPLSSGDGLTVERVNESSVIVRAARPTHAYVLLLGGPEAAVRVANEGAPLRLSAGRHRVPTVIRDSRRAPVSSGSLPPNRNDLRYCGRGGERLVYGERPPTHVPPSAVRPVRVRNARAWCVRGPETSIASGAVPPDRQVLLLTSAEPIDAALLSAAVSEANRRYTGIAVPGEEIAGAVTGALPAGRVSAYPIRVPN
jgi:hypothetical protein